MTFPVSVKFVGPNKFLAPFLVNLKANNIHFLVASEKETISLVAAWWVLYDPEFFSFKGKQSHLNFHLKESLIVCNYVRVMITFCELREKLGYCG